MQTAVEQLRDEIHRLDIDRVASLLSSHDYERELVFAFGAIEHLTPVWEATKASFANGNTDFAVLRLLLDEGFIIDMQGATVLHGTTGFRKIFTTRYDGLEPVFHAIVPFLVCREELQSLGGIDCRDTDGNTTLHWAMANNLSPSEIEILLQVGSDPNATNHQGLTPLHVAVNHWRLDSIEFLISHGADPNRRAADGLDCRKLAQRNLEFENTQGSFTAKRRNHSRCFREKLCDYFRQMEQEETA